MSSLQFVPKWNININQLENGEPISAGEEGLINIAPKQLAENIWWLKDKVEANKTSSDELLIPKTEKGAANGVATLGADSKLPAEQLPPLGTAASKNTGTTPGTIPLNDNLGTAASKNTGTANGTIPLNDNLGTAASKNIGTGTGQILTADKFKTAAFKNIGSGNDEISLNLAINAKFDTVNTNIANIVNFTYIGATEPETVGLAVNSVWLDTSTEI